MQILQQLPCSTRPDLPNNFVSIEILRDAGSTNAELIARVSAGETVNEGHWLIADRQTAGRGRQGREWFDGAGNFMGSTVVRTRFGDPAPGSLALLSGLALYEVITLRLPAPQKATLKWPNDVLIGGAKLAGILLEMAGDTVVIGIGVNLAHAPQLSDREAVSLAQLGAAIDRNSFAEELAAQFAVELARWRDYGLAHVVARWMAAGHPIGTTMRVGEPPLIGSFAGLNEDGALQLRLPDGTKRIIHAGEVRLN